MNADVGEVAVLLVDDQELVRSGLRRILRRKDGFNIVGECSDGDQVLDAVAAHRPDVVVMDLRMKRIDGIEATRQLAIHDGPPVLALTTFNEDELLSRALRAGATGYVLKDSLAEELIRAVRSVAKGESYLDPAVTSRVLSTYRTATRATYGDATSELTARELDVLRLVARARTNTEIAAELHISEVTVKGHIRRIFGKLDVRNRAAAIVYAYDHGVVLPEIPHQERL
ncbi:response regulator transcription factor [Mycobacterium sp. Aquia_213]|uniref:response regulator transcription factor n=1 Tax=Mycobacterium sp. Aquia_213 TaxID=2991728 RepID=UPI002270E275|nr:response regulator transcription factor [Mycobacterium sp. Aquia_213]WAC90183.1 response regulator transcription factor [Mycobacterium sp. Aquia_213]